MITSPTPVLQSKYAQAPPAQLIAKGMPVASLRASNRFSLMNGANNLAMIPKGRPPLLPGIIPDKSVTANRAYRNASNAPMTGYSAPPVNAIIAEQHPQMLVTSTKMTLNGGGGR